MDAGVEAVVSELARDEARDPYCDEGLDNRSDRCCRMCRDHQVRTEALEKGGEGIWCEFCGMISRICVWWRKWAVRVSDVYVIFVGMG